MSTISIFNAWDLQLLHTLHSFATPELDSFFKCITHMGDFKFMTALLVILLLYRYTRRIGVQILIAEILQLTICGYFLKNLIARARPFIIDPTIELIIKAPKSFSCPSGHTSTVFALAFALICSRYPKYWGYLALTWALLISLSRLYLQVHFPTDVGLGAIMGCLCGYASSKIINAKYLSSKIR